MPSSSAKSTDIIAISAKSKKFAASIQPIFGVNNSKGVSLHYKFCIKMAKRFKVSTTADKKVRLYVGDISRFDNGNGFGFVEGSGYSCQVYQRRERR